MAQPAELLTRTPSDRPDRLLRNRNFVLLWCAYGISAMGDHLSEMAILKTQNAFDAAVDITPLKARMAFAFFLPFFFLGPIAGLVADRFPRRMIMISADLVRAGIMGAFVSLLAVTQNWGVWGPFLPLLFTGAFAALFSPARSALLPTLIHPRQLVRANGMIGGLGIIATMISATLSGYLAKHYDPRLSFQIDAATFAASAFCLALLRPPAPAPSAPAMVRASPWSELRAGFRYVGAHRPVRELLLVSALVWFCGLLVDSVIPAVVRDTYAGDPQGISLYRALVGLGFVFGAIVITALGEALRGEVAMTWGLVGVGLAIGVLAASTFLPLEATTLARLGAVAVVLTGFFGVGVIATFNSLLQRIVADRFRGRVFGVNDLISTGAMLLATGALSLPTGLRLDRWVGPILAGVSLATFAAGVLTLVRRYARAPFPPKTLFLWHVNELVSKAWWGLRRDGPVTVPRHGACIVAANHRSTPDPALLSACVPHRLLSFFIAAEYADWPVFRYFVKLLGCIPVRRGTRETAATRRALDVLREGRAMAAFIEGGILRPGQSPRLKDGVALLALRTGAPVIPAHISGVRYTQGVVGGLFARHRARIRFGPPVDLSEFRGAEGRERVRAASAKIYHAILALAPPGEPPVTPRSGDPRETSNTRSVEASTV